MRAFNDYIIRHRSRQYLSKLGIREIIADKHGPEGLDYTIYNKKNNTTDGIWGFPGLFTTSCGYLPVNYGLKSYHRLIWIKIPLGNALVDNTLPSKTPLARKILLHHPDDQQKYISNLRHITRQHNLIPMLIDIENHQKWPPSPEYIKAYEK